MIFEYQLFTGLGWRESFTNPVFHIPLNLLLEVTVVLGDAKTISSELFRARVMSILSHRLDDFKAVVQIPVAVFPFPTITVDVQFLVFVHLGEPFTLDDHFICKGCSFEIKISHFLSFLTKIQKLFGYDKSNRNTTSILL